MTVTVYVNWNAHRFLTEKEYKKEIERLAKELVESEDIFTEWLEENYNAVEMFNMEGGQKEEVRKTFLKDMIEEEVNSGFGYDCEEFTFEI